VTATTETIKANEAHKYLFSANANVGSYSELHTNTHTHTHTLHLLNAQLDKSA